MKISSYLQIKLMLPENNFPAGRKRVEINNGVEIYGLVQRQTEYTLY